MNTTQNQKGIKLVLLILFLLFSAWWLVLHTVHPKSENINLYFGATYGVVTLLGAYYGITNAKKWGGLKSALGRTLIFLSIGLLFSEFGQLVFSYYNIVKDVEIPYPSIADIGFFGMTTFSVLATLSLAKTVGVKFSTFKKHLFSAWVLVIPVIVLSISYKVFLQGYSTQDTSTLQIFLDFAYPLGQAIAVSVVISSYVFASTKLGGIMKKRILLLLLAFVLQYSADFNFLYQNTHGTWVNGGYGDYLYFLAYCIQALSLILLVAPSVTVTDKILNRTPKDQQ